MRPSKIVMSSKTVICIVLILGAIVTVGLFGSSVYTLLRHSNKVGAAIILLLSLFTLTLTIVYYNYNYLAK
jgi:hypothetical protein